MVWGDSFGLSFEIQNQTVTQCGKRYRFDVVEAHIEPAVDHRPNFARENQRLASAGAAPEPQVL
jgi:hypothetical protein